jgi:hypothetical protein
VLVLLLIGAAVYIVSLSERNAVLSSTIETLQHNADTMKEQFFGTAEEDTPQESTPLAQQSDAERAAIDAVAGYMQVLNQVTNTTTRQQQIDAIQNYATDHAQKELWGDTPVQSDTGGDGENTAFSQTCTQAAAYTSIVDANTIDVFGVYLTQLTGGEVQTGGTILVTARCVQQNGQWLVDTARQSVPNNLSIENFVME